MSELKKHARLELCVNSELRKTIEDAAAVIGQTVSDFAISVLAETSRQILHEEQTTRLSEVDRLTFVELLEDETARPNTALFNAVRRYRKQVG